MVVFWWFLCGVGGGGFCVDGGEFSVGGDGNRVVVAVFSLFLIWILCGCWWVVLVHGGGGRLGFTFFENRFFTSKTKCEK